MNKKVIIVVIGCVCVLATTGVVVSYKSRPAEIVNPSRRDGKVVDGGTVTDEDLNGVNGELEESNDLSGTGQSEAAKKREEEDSTLLSSLESIEATAPVAKNVESVEVMLIPEAVSINDGNAGDFYANEDFENVIPVDVKSFSREELPSKYDSRNVDGKSYVTKVENQGYSYLCWCYAALGAVESDLLMHYPELSRDELDLSEKHLAYYNMHRSSGSVGGYLDDDFREFLNADNEDNAWIFDYDTNYVATGGVADFCISLLTAWKGPVMEKDNDAFNSVFGEKKLFEDNSDKPSDAYSGEYHVQGVNEVPSGFGNNTMIKQMIMEHGAVTAGIYSDDRFWKKHNKSIYAAFDGNEIPTANHEVIIIGWDDNYSASNFVKIPPADGAWICRNSWGETSGDNGFFYLSYYDETTGVNNVAAYKTVIKGDEDYYDNNYQASGFLTYMISTTDDSENYMTAYSESTNPYGMLYKSQQDEILEAIGLMGLETYCQYEIEIFVNPEHEEDGIAFSSLKKPALQMKASAISGGYHTYKLPDKIKLSAGDEFFILVKPVTSGRVPFEKAADHISKPNYDEWKNLTGNIHNNYSASGCSYYIADDGKGMIRQNDKDFFVKAYTKNITE